MNYNRLEEHIVDFLRDYAVNAGSNGYVMGCSGGIDSTVVSTLAAKTGLNVLLYSLNIHQGANQASRAQDHMNWLVSNYDNVTKMDFNLTEAYDTMVRGLESHSNLNSVDLETRNLVLANTRSRLRMVSLYAIAAQNKLLVCGTGNKVEDFGVGFFTKYGDGGVDISPIADLMKSEVYALGAHLGVNQDILDARPTDGLWDDGRTDEDQIGCTYDELEWAMNYAEAHGLEITPTDADTLDDRQLEVFSIYRGRHLANQHKMNPIPVCEVPEDIKNSETVTA